MNKGVIHFLGSGSEGNTAVITDSRQRSILLDLGVNWKTILKGINYDLWGVDLALVTHCHSDHTLSLRKAIDNYIPCYANADVCSKYNGCNVINDMLLYNEWRIQTFELVHSVPNNAFIIDTSDNIRILYCTDTVYIPKVVKNVNYAIIECNNDTEFMLDEALEGNIRNSHYETHQNIDDCITYLKHIYNPDLQGIILCHLSQGNINGVAARERVRNELGFKNVFIATEGLKIALQRSEF